MPLAAAASADPSSSSGPDTYRRMDYRDGSQTVSADVAAHLRRMLEVSSRAPTSGVQRRLLSAVGDAAQLAAWLAIDAQHYERARGYCQLAQSVADKANDRALHAYTLGVTSSAFQDKMTAVASQEASIACRAAMPDQPVARTPHERQHDGARALAIPGLTSAVLRKMTVARADTGTREVRPSDGSANGPGEVVHAVLTRR
jgi:hypothetical protein